MASLAPALAPPPVVGPLPTGFGLGQGREVTKPTMANPACSDVPLLPLPVGLSPCSSRRINVVLTRRPFLLLPPCSSSRSTPPPRQAPPARSQGMEQDGCRIQDPDCRRRQRWRDPSSSDRHCHSQDRQGHDAMFKVRPSRTLGLPHAAVRGRQDSARRWCGGWSHFRLGRRLAEQLSDWNRFLVGRGVVGSLVAVLVRPSLANAHLAGLVLSPTARRHPPSFALRPPGTKSSRHPRPHGNRHSLCTYYLRRTLSTNLLPRFVLPLLCLLFFLLSVPFLVLGGLLYLGRWIDKYLEYGMGDVLGGGSKVLYVGGG
ncbi:hypothetical protein FB45DRAFT_941620, partial [Roridomyces roridus]